METYVDDEGNVQSFIGDDDVIIGIPGRGRQLHGAVTLVEGSSFKTYAGNYVPAYRANENDNTVSLAMYCVVYWLLNPWTTGRLSSKIKEGLL